MARVRATVAVVLAAAVAAATVAAAAATPDAASATTDAGMAIGPVPAVERVLAHRLETAPVLAEVPTASDMAATLHAEEGDSDGEEEEQGETAILDPLSRGRRDDGRRRRQWQRRPAPRQCIVKVWEVLKAPPTKYRSRRGSPRQVLLVRKVLTARRVRGGRLGRRATRTKAWACTKRWAKVRSGRTTHWRPRYVCTYVGTPWRMCSSWRRRRAYRALCGRRLRRVGRVWPAVRVRPEGGARCDADPEPSPEY